MANPHKGELALDLDGKTYTLVLDANAIVEAETLLDRGVNDFDMRRIGTMRALLWAALRRYHPEMTLLDAGELITGNGNRIGDKLGEAIRLAFPPEEQGERPRKAGRAGSGTPS
jgi:hypothetical protein